MKKKKLKIFLIVLAVIIGIALTIGLTFMFIGRSKYDDVYKLPIMNINTENKQKINSKEEYVLCDVGVSNADEKYLLENEPAKIRGRGNSSWDMPKKSYKLKFDKKQDLFGNGKAKTWTLIANYGDPTMMRNYLAYNIASTFDDLKYTTTTQFVDLYLNGKYIGVYLVCEQNETGKTRVDIDESMESVDTGYLLEMDSRAADEGEEGIDYFVSNGKNFTIKTPDTEDENYSVDYLNFIKNYLDNCFSVLQGNDWSAVESLLEVRNFADSYIINEIFKTKDINMASFFIYKDKGGKLASGPIWDYDTSSGNCNYSKAVRNPKNLYANTNIFYKYLLNFAEFKEIVKEKVIKYSDNIKTIINDEISYVKNNYYESFHRNYFRWPQAMIGTWPNSFQIIIRQTWKSQLKYLKNWLNDSVDYLVKVYVND